MPRYRHIIQNGTARRQRYTSTNMGGGKFKSPPRDRVVHGQRLLSELQTAAALAAEQAAKVPLDERPQGVVLEFLSEPKWQLKLESLERQASGIELLNVRLVDGRIHAAVFVPRDKLVIFERQFNRYLTEDVTNQKKGTTSPKNQKLVESIASIRLAIIQSFWTDTTNTFPAEGEAVWWEVWLRSSDATGTVELFKAAGAKAGLQMTDHSLRFPERIVVLAFGTLDQWRKIHNLADFLAELRRAKAVPSEFLKMSGREQAILIDDALARIQPPPADAPAVLLLDTGMNRGHALLSLATNPADVQSCEPNWSPADLRGHGTEMAGIALYGCLTSLLGTNLPTALTHRLESVKMMPDGAHNEVAHFGALTVQAVYRAEIAAPTRNRAICMAITTFDSRDEGRPSAWSSAVDQICSGAETSRRQLMFVSAGNVPTTSRHEYPGVNYLQPVEDPAQCWNAVTVGAFTEKDTVRETSCADWKVVAPFGGLSPSSRTSLPWTDKSWASKPDVVFEGGNAAIDPSSGSADCLDDLSLLTTRLDQTGRLLTTTGDTSAATAQAARMAAIIWVDYPQFWPETIRGLMVHSAQWTDQMITDFPKARRAERLRCVGHGVPNLERALWSANNAVTLIVQDSLQPFIRDGSIRTHDCHIHHLKWPKDVLRDLGAVPVSMRVTLSYFVEPSPGRYGQMTKQRYQSHGLRFDVQLPNERLESFHKRVNRAQWDDFKKGPKNVKDDRDWDLGEQLCTKGSIHQDTWHGLANELSECGVIAVYPITGWWRERPHLDKWSRSARYSLIVSLETPQTEVDLHTPIVQQIVQETELF